MTQEKALALLKSGRNIFLTGSAGTGKTYVLNQYIQYLKDRKVPTAVTASTGIAATHLNGMTIHSWSGIGIKDNLSLAHLIFLQQKKYMRDKMEDVKVLIIDEISMLHRKQLDLVNEVLQFFKGNTLPFGGVQVVFSGDFFQLPPIGSEWETSKHKFCFMSHAWVQAQLKVCYLTQQYRQSKNFLNQLLNEIRSRNLSSESYNLVNEKAQEAMYSDVNRFPQLYTHNADVDKINEIQLNLINAPAKKFKAVVKGNKTLGETLKNNVLAPEIIYLKEGAEVMFVKNNFEKLYSNGTLGVVRGFTEEGFPLVETKDGNWIEARSEEWKIEDETGKTLVSYTQIPLRLAWAITIHKSQGMTLDEACVDLRKTFEKGQGYVALSRLKDFDKLTLLGVNDLAMQLDDLAFRADQRFLELSDEVDSEFELDDLSLEHRAFVLKCGGTVDEKKIKKNRQKKKSKKEKTHLVTKEMLDAGLSLEEIAEERGYSLETILGHLNKVKEIYPKTDFSSIVVDKDIIIQVKKALQKIEFEDNKIKLKPIFEFLNEMVSYEDIQRALLKI
ncbi:conjugal transfer relaxase TraA [Candidatus Ornithobacterium hominis]|uniref:helix-turn-helix domain-containing protein n=1 Tax=Candidatus Ornithobacterium hominis TaxID=2497989 RepID=UPI000E5BB185|nr:helix-turn-helix domain-containing protein [Candidatus Ornithobacterium hominis]SZD71753.1 conjugal transfer relaxase TraA [Candidatus Ornithobacterium hominis]